MPFDPPAPAGAFALVATRRFLRDAGAFRRKFPAFGQALRAFCRFRAEAVPTEPYNTKDGRMAGTLSHLRRCHLVHGKAVVIYATAGRAIRLLAATDHDGIEGRAVAEIAAYVRALGEDDFEPAMDLLDDPEVVALRAEVTRLRARAEADAASLRRLERECADAWMLAEEEAAARARAEAELEAARGERRKAVQRPASPPPASPAVSGETGRFALGARLRASRQARGLSQADVALASGLSQPQVSLCERGAKVPDYVTGALEAWALAAACAPAARRASGGP